MADKKGSKLPVMGSRKPYDSLGVTILRILGLGLAGGAALIVMADSAGKKIEQRTKAKEEEYEEEYE